jgi:hypothetical protein
MEEISKLKKITNPHLRGNTKAVQNNLPEQGKDRIEKVIIQ